MAASKSIVLTQSEEGLRNEGGKRLSSDIKENTFCGLCKFTVLFFISLNVFGSNEIGINETLLMFCYLYAFQDYSSSSCCLFGCLSESG